MTEPALPSAADLVAFWQAAGPSRWFRKDPAFDDEFRARFLRLHEAAAAGALASWIQDPQSALALVLLLDQFPRNAFRGSPRMYATDWQGRAAARAAITAGHDQRVDAELRPFFYLPLMHSEEPQDLARCVELMEPLGGEHLRYAQHHRDIVDRFGRFPHRNALLGRASTPAEESFLAGGGFGG
ncbi:DUF924 family protein [Ramlibacter sp. G-1-2-2]|uniref:DUF924 family protein n=1 Tax=Ramlibacter agri TaxID=2728837 RepID=A0A848HFR0_9BURK|nr:DUF924 family protein [Ramlibacter agri]NML48171.1 DUF924 family protein [Ramlibacter agri]